MSPFSGSKMAHPLEQLYSSNVNVKVKLRIIICFRIKYRVNNCTILMEKSITSNISAPTKSDGRVEYAFFMECHRRGHDFDIRGKNIRTALAKGGSVQERSQIVLVVAYAQDLVHARSR